MEWYYRQDNESKGPVDGDALKAKIAAGELGPDDYLWTQDMGQEWKRIRDVVEMASAMARPAPVSTLADVLAEDTSLPPPAAPATEAPPILINLGVLAVAIVLALVGGGLYYFFRSGWVFWVEVALWALAGLAFLGSFSRRHYYCTHCGRDVGTRIQPCPECGCPNMTTVEPRVEDLLNEEKLAEILCDAIQPLCQAALERISVPLNAADPDDHRVYRTPVGLRLIYTIDKEDTRFCHHVSAAGVDKCIPGEACGMLLTLFVGIVHVKWLDQLEIDSYVSQNDIAHSEFYLNVHQQKRFEAMAYEKPDEAEEPAEEAAEEEAETGRRKLRLKH